jgi:hypothetical protein
MSAGKIRALNDAFRRTMIGGRVMMTAGVDALSNVNKALLLEKVREFDPFTDDNDPHGEHDFGAIDFLGQKFFFKLDYYGGPLVPGVPIGCRSPRKRGPYSMPIHTTSSLDNSRRRNVTVNAWFREA